MRSVKQKETLNVEQFKRHLCVLSEVLPQKECNNLVTKEAFYFKEGYRQKLRLHGKLGYKCDLIMYLDGDRSVALFWTNNSITLKHTQTKKKCGFVHKIEEVQEGEINGKI